MERKHIELTEFEVKFADTGVATIEGYASTFGNVDSQNDIVMPGAFKDSLAQRMPKMLYQHDPHRIPGVWESGAEDSKGLILVGKTLNTTLGRDAAEELRSGAIDRLSIGYSPTKSAFDKAKGTRRLEQVKLWEASLVTFPANERAVITGVKGAHENEREFEEFLREAGYSRDAAKIIVAKGFKALSGQREAGGEEAVLTHILNQFKI
ncbi:HK97 family phage prohead protease [Gemmata sp. G18]|uniref:HK97 family phage prohead protease n=1 Tax=Gemmata palustris TaxID=2822762 RepID=A0ABS5BX84_9BACT|nr:HK97 family phage prohead protease [Gemmata palustris]MBP3958352.1 HK97 family phage prohead protease [Gemmata palustris]